MLNKIKRKRMGAALAVFIALWLGIGGISQAYPQTKQMNNSRAVGSDNYKSVEDSENKSSKKFHLQRVTRKQALQAIADRTNLTLAYRSGLFGQATERISVSGSEVNYKDVIDEVLSNSGLEFKITESRHLVVFKKEKANVTGTVVDQATGSPLQGARVMLMEENDNSNDEPKIEKASFVGANGKYNIEDVAAGTYKLVIVYFGYSKAFENVVVNSGTTVGNFKVEEK